MLPLPPAASASRCAERTTPDLIFAANHRTKVALPNGSLGTLVYVGQRSRKAKVKVGGRHVRIPADQLIIIEGTSS